MGYLRIDFVITDLNMPEMGGYQLRLPCERELSKHTDHGHDGNENPRDRETTLRPRRFTVHREAV